MKTITRVIGVTALLLVVFAFLPALLPGRMGEALMVGVGGIVMLTIKAAWTVALAYLGARLALRHERGFTNG